MILVLLSSNNLSNYFAEMLLKSKLIEDPFSPGSSVPTPSNKKDACIAPANAPAQGATHPTLETAESRPDLSGISKRLKNVKGKSIPCDDPHPPVEYSRRKYSTCQFTGVSTTLIEIEDEAAPSLGGIRYFLAGNSLHLYLIS